MGSNLQRNFRQDLFDLLAGLTVTYTDGTSDNFVKDVNLFYSRVPDAVVNNTNIVVIPKAPKFVTTVLGQGGRTNGKEKVVAMEVVIFHDHADTEQMTNNLEDLVWTVSEAIIDRNPRLGGAMFVDVLDTDIMIAEYKDQDDNNLTSINFGWILVQARYPRQ